MRAMLVAMGLSIAGLQQELAALKGMPIAARNLSKVKGKEEATEDNEELETSVNPGNATLFEDEDKELPAPVFNVGPPPADAGAKGADGGGPTNVIATTYPAAWSSYLTPTGDKSSSSMGGLQKTAKWTNSPIRAIPTFSGAAGEDVHLWISKVKLRGAQSGWNQRTLIAQASAALEGAAATWLHTAGEDIMFKFARFEAELIKSFAPSSRVELLNEFFVCSQERSESVRDFYYRLLLLGKRGGLVDPDLFAARFREGLRTEVRKSVEILPSRLPIEKLYERAREIEARLVTSPGRRLGVAVVEEETSRAVEELRSDLREIANGMREVVARVRDGQAAPRRRTPMSEIQCHRCRKNGHFARDCTEPMPANNGAVSGAEPPGVGRAQASSPTAMMRIIYR